jgi:AraC family transcriptional regulator
VLDPEQPAPDRPSRQIRGRRGTGARVRRRIDEACAALGSELADQITLTDLARMLQVSPYHLARQFRARTGMTIHAYREQLRLRAAAALCLADRDARLDDIAAAVGFSSHSHLTARFHRSFGVSPSVVRLQAPIRPATLS